MSSLQITTQQQCCNFTSLSHVHSASIIRGSSYLRIFGLQRPQQLGNLAHQITPAPQSLIMRASNGVFIVLDITNDSLFAKQVVKEIPKAMISGNQYGKNSFFSLIIFELKQGSPFKVFEKGLGLFKKDSVEDILRKQIEKQEYYDDGGSGGSGLGGGGGGGGGGGDSSSGSGGPADENIWDEVFQVIFGTIGFIFLYMLIIEGEEITTFAKDIIRFLFTRRMSIRLRRLRDDWVRTFRSLTEQKEEDPYWLEKAIIKTPTWWDSPAKYKLMYRRYMSSRYDDYE